MRVLDHGQLKTYDVPGMRHQTLAGSEHGLKTLEVWTQAIDPGGATPRHKHDCEEVFIVQQGQGTIRLEDEELPFAAGTTVIVPPGVVHEVVNTGEEELTYLVVLGMAPVRLETADGHPVHRPWLTT